MATRGKDSAGPFIVWSNPAKAGLPGKAACMAARLSEGRYEIRQQVAPGYWTVIAVFTLLRRIA